MRFLEWKSFDIYKYRCNMNWTAIGSIATVVGVFLTIYYNTNIPASTSSVINQTKSDIHTNNDNKLIIKQSANEIIQWYQNIKKVSTELEAQELAKKKYIGKYIRITGIIKDIESSDTTGATIIVNSINEQSIIFIANFIDKNEVYALNKNNFISISGKIQTLNEHFIAIDNSQIIDTSSKKSQIFPHADKTYASVATPAEPKNSK